jgi:hypothetical protein
MDTYCDSLVNPAVLLLDNAPIQTSKAVLAKREEWEKRGLYPPAFDWEEPKDSDWGE